MTACRLIDAVHVVEFETRHVSVNGHPHPRSVRIRHIVDSAIDQTLCERPAKAMYRIAAGHEGETPLCPKYLRAMDAIEATTEATA